MINMYSIAELIDKLIIENIKIFRIREKMHDGSLDEGTYVEYENKMNVINENRTTIIKFLNKKFEDVLSGKDQNTYFKDVKTYKN